MQIASHPRVVDDSVRQKDSKRKTQREAKKQRKAEEALKRTEEIKRIKAEKKKEITQKLKEIAEITGTNSTALQGLGLTGEFDPEEHDRQMSALFNDDFYSAPIADHDTPDGMLCPSSRCYCHFFKARLLVYGIDSLNDDLHSLSGTAIMAEEAEEEKPDALFKPGRYLSEAKKKLQNAGKTEIAKEIDQKLDDLYKLDFEDIVRCWFADVCWSRRLSNQLCMFLH